jgi:hypothetical protein
VGRKLRLELSGEYYEFSTDLAGSSLDETRYWFRLRYGNPVTRNALP